MRQAACHEATGKILATQSAFASASALRIRICKQTHKVCGKSRIKFEGGKVQRGSRREGGKGGQVKVCRNKSIKCSQCKVRRESARAVAKNYLSGKNLCIMRTVNSKL